MTIPEDINDKFLDELADPNASEVEPGMIVHESYCHTCRDFYGADYTGTRATFDKVVAMSQCIPCRMRGVLTMLKWEHVL